MLSPDGQLGDVEENEVEAASAAGYRIAPPDVATAGSEGPLAGVYSAGRTLLRGGSAVAGDVNAQAKEAAEAQGLPYTAPRDRNDTAPQRLAPSLYDEHAKTIAAANPGYTLAGQMVGEAPLMAVPGVGAGIAVGALGGGVNQELEDAWQQDRDASIEAMATNTLGGIVAGTALHGAFKVMGAVSKATGRAAVSLLDMAEERAAKRGAGDLLESVATGQQTLGDVEAAIGKGRSMDPAVRDLGANAKVYREQVAESASADIAAVRDGVDELTKRTLSPEVLTETIPENRAAQESWALRTRADMKDAAEEILLRSESKGARKFGKALLQKSAAMADASEPAEWFTLAASAREDLLHAERAVAREGTARRVGEAVLPAASAAGLAAYAIDKNDPGAGSAAAAVGLGLLGRGRGRALLPTEVTQRGWQHEWAPLISRLAESKLTTAEQASEAIARAARRAEGISATAPAETERALNDWLKAERDVYQARLTDLSEPSALPAETPESQRNAMMWLTAEGALAEKQRPLTDMEHEAVNEWVGMSSGDFRHAYAGEPTGKWTTELFPHLQSGLEKLALDKPQGTFFRGLGLPAEAIKELLEKDTFVTRAPTSVSVSRGLGESFAAAGPGQHRVLLRVQNPDRAFNLAKVNAGESELLLAPGGKYKVTGRAYDPKEDMFVFDLEGAGKERDPWGKLAEYSSLVAPLALGAAGASAAKDDNTGVGAAAAIGLGALAKGRGGAMAHELTRLRGISDLLERAVGDTDVWGRAASNETKRLGILAARLDEGGGTVERTLFRDGKAEPKAMNAVLRKGSAASPERQALERYLDMAESVAGVGAASADKGVAAKAQKTLEATGRMRQALSKGDVIRLVADRAKGAAKRESNPLSLGELAKDAAAGYAADYVTDKITGDLPHGVGAIAGVAIRRGKLLQRMLGIGQLSRAGDAGTVRALLSPVQRALGAAAPVARLVGENAPKAAAAAASSYGAWDRNPERYEATASRVRELAQDPQKLFGALADTFPESAADAPDVHAELTRQSLKQVQFLANKLPPAPRRAFGSPIPATVAPSARWEFGLYVDAATDPDSVRTALVAGTLRRQQIETLQALYPQRLQALRMDAVQSARALQSSGRTLSVSARRTLDLLGLSDPTFSWQVASNVLAARQARRAEPPAPPAAGMTQKPPGIAAETPGGLATLQAAAGTMV